MSVCVCVIHPCDMWKIAGVYLHGRLWQQTMCKFCTSTATAAATRLVRFNGFVNNIVALLCDIWYLISGALHYYYYYYSMLYVVLSCLASCYCYYYYCCCCCDCNFFSYSRDTNCFICQSFASQLQENIAILNSKYLVDSILVGVINVICDQLVCRT